MSYDVKIGNDTLTGVDRVELQNANNLEEYIGFSVSKPEQSKTLSLGASAPSTVTPDSGKVLSSVPVMLDTSVIKAENIKKDVQMLGITGTHAGQKPEQSKTVTPTASGFTVTPDSGNVLSSVVINGDTNLAAGNIKSGVSVFGVNGSLQPAKPEQSKTLTLGATAPATVLPDSSKVLSSVPVSLDASVIKAENIKKDVKVLGVTGTHEGDGYEPGQVEFGSGPSMKVPDGEYTLSSIKRIFGFNDIRGATIVNGGQSIFNPEIGDSAFFENYTNGELDGVTFVNWWFYEWNARVLLKNVNAKIRFNNCLFGLGQQFYMIEHSFVDLVFENCVWQ